MVTGSRLCVTVTGRFVRSLFIFFLKKHWSQIQYVSWTCWLHASISESWYVTISSSSICMRRPIWSYTLTRGRSTPSIPAGPGRERRFGRMECGPRTKQKAELHARRCVPSVCHRRACRSQSCWARSCTSFLLDCLCANHTTTRAEQGESHAQRNAITATRQEAGRQCGRSSRRWF
jgi:hypothetical protein